MSSVCLLALSLPTATLVAWMVPATKSLCGFEELHDFAKQVNGRPRNCPLTMVSVWSRPIQCGMCHPYSQSQDQACWCKSIVCNEHGLMIIAQRNPFESTSVDCDAASITTCSHTSPDTIRLDFHRVDRWGSVGYPSLSVQRCYTQRIHFPSDISARRCFETITMSRLMIGLAARSGAVPGLVARTPTSVLETVSWTARTTFVGPDGSIHCRLDMPCLIGSTIISDLLSVQFTAHETDVVPFRR